MNFCSIQICNYSQRSETKTLLWSHNSRSLEINSMSFSRRNILYNSVTKDSDKVLWEKSQCRKLASFFEKNCRSKRFLDHENFFFNILGRILQIFPSELHIFIAISAISAPHSYPNFVFYVLKICQTIYQRTWYELFF